MLKSKKTRGKHYTVTLDGELSIYNAAAFKQELKPCLDDCKSIAFDLSAVTEMDTSCFQVLMQVKRECEKAGKEMQMVAHSPAVLEILDLYGMERFFGDPLVLVSENIDKSSAATKTA